MKPPVTAIAAVWLLAASGALGENRLQPAASPIVTVEAHRFTGGSEREDSMWSALYGAKSGKLYIGLCTHAEAAHFYEFDPATQTMHHIADLTEFKGERGAGVRTSGKIHVRMSEDEQGRIYFGDFCEDTGPECVDPASYRGPHWFRYDPKQRKLENLGRINRQWGLLGFVFEPRYQRLYGPAEDGHPHTFDLKTKVTEDVCKLISYDTTGREGFRDWGVLAVDRSPYYAKRAYQFDAMTVGADGTIFIGESDRRACLFLFLPGGKGFEGGFNPSNPR